MQVDPIIPVFKAPGIERLKLESVELLSRFAFKFNLYRYSVAIADDINVLVQQLRHSYSSSNALQCPR